MIGFMNELVSYMPHRRGGIELIIIGHMRWPHVQYNIIKMGLTDSRSHNVLAHLRSPLRQIVLHQQ